MNILWFLAFFCLPNIYCTLHIFHPTLYILHSTLYTSHSTLFTPRLIFINFISWIACNNHYLRHFNSTKKKETMIFEQPTWDGVDKKWFKKKECKIDCKQPFHHFNWKTYQRIDLSTSFLHVKNFIFFFLPKDDHMNTQALFKKPFEIVVKHGTFLVPAKLPFCKISKIKKKNDN